MKKGLFKLFAIIGLIASSSLVQANTCPIRTVGGQDLNICPPSQSHSVPELNAAGAPVALLLLAGLVALGFERRRNH